jgi:PP-loop superfamily ATP-utilizing enzyme
MFRGFKLHFFFAQLASWRDNVRRMKIVLAYSGGLDTSGLLNPR